MPEFLSSKVFVVFELFEVLLMVGRSGLAAPLVGLVGDMFGFVCGSSQQSGDILLELGQNLSWSIGVPV
jgi:hypothetical protein